ncbi:MAG: biotin--[acetyl-CoA-carboxylase] ligase [Actinomycetes bacterium]
MSAREPLNAEELASTLLRPGGFWTSLEIADSIDSTNSVLAERANTGAAVSGAILVAEEQTAGRGRRGRSWLAPKHSSLMVSVLIEPAVDQSQWGWMPLVTALAVTDAVARNGVHSSIKWPNDVVVAESKLAGVLCEVVSTPTGHAVIAGWGINVDQHRDELPVADATSMLLCNGAVDRAALLTECLRGWEFWFACWNRADPSDHLVVDTYVARSSTLGREVRVDLPGGSTISGVARRLDSNGHLVVDVDGVEQTVAAADVVHLRPERLRP